MDIQNCFENSKIFNLILIRCILQFRSREQSILEF